MTHIGLEGFRAVVGDVREVVTGLGDTQWSTPSAAEGWTVEDVVNHLGDLLDILTSAVRGTLNTDLGIEALNEVDVAEKRHRTGLEALEALEASVAGALPVFASLQQEPTASVEAPFLDLGTYPLHFMADICCFDFLTHLRWDILGPRGPISRTLEPPDEVRLAPSVGWLLAGIPRMQRDLPEALTGTIDLALSGPGGGSWRLTRTDGTIRVMPWGGGPPADAMVASSTLDFLAWSSTRVPWRQAATVTGNEGIAARFLDRLNLT